MKNNIGFSPIIPLVKISLILLILTSCSIQNRSMKSTSELLLLNVKDFELSEQVTASATVVRVFGVDWKRLFSWQTGVIGDGIQTSEIQVGTGYHSISALDANNNDLTSISTFILPVLGTILRGNAPAYALNTLMQENPGYDMIIYPQYNRKKKVVPFFYSKTEVEVTARLGKLKTQ